MHNSWDKIVGHQWAVQLLVAAVEHDRVGHAYLITGPVHIGKTTLARTFAQSLNCTAPAADRPCGNCRSCQLIATDRHPDIRLVAPILSSRGKPSLKIDQIRELQQGLSLSAYEARCKVAILPQFDAATAGAANAFLKTLEEPPNNVVLLLTAGDADTLLATISSRCRHVGLRPLSTDLIEQSLLTRWHVAEDEATLLAHLADGRLGWAVRASQDPEIMRARETQLTYLQDALADDRAGRFSLADKLARKPEALPIVLRQWLSWWRDLMQLAQLEQTASFIAAPSITNIDRREQLQQLAKSWPAADIVTSLQQTNRALWQLQRNANTRLVVENLLLTYPLIPANFLS